MINKTRIKVEQQLNKSNNNNKYYMTLTKGHHAQTWRTAKIFLCFIQWQYA
jgi:hypothetical protein